MRSGPGGSSSLSMLIARRDSSSPARASPLAGEGPFQLLAGGAGLGYGARRIQGDDQARERVGEDVVHLTRQALSLGKGGGLGLGGAGLLQLGDEELRLLVGADEPAGEDGENEVERERQLDENNAVEWPRGVEAGGERHRPHRDAGRSDRLGLGNRNEAAATGGYMKRKPGPSGCTATRTAAAPIIASTISIFARAAAGGMRSNDSSAATKAVRASVTARPLPVKPGAGRARKVTAARTPRAATARGKVQRSVAATLTRRSAAPVPVAAAGPMSGDSTPVATTHVPGGAPQTPSPAGKMTRS